jgi:hypothetical protein
MEGNERYLDPVTAKRRIGVLPLYVFVGLLRVLTNGGRAWFGYRSGQFR